MQWQLLAVGAPNTAEMGWKNRGKRWLILTKDLSFKYLPKEHESTNKIEAKLTRNRRKSRRNMARVLGFVLAILSPINYNS